MLILCAVLLFTVMDGLAKYLGGRGYPIWQIVFCRSLFSLVPILVIALNTGGLRRLATRRPVAHFLRSSIGLASLFCFFYAFREMPLADAMALSFSAPLFVTALSVPLLGERVGVHRWGAVMVGFVGVVVMIQPGSGLFQPIAFLVLASALFYALAIVLIRRLSESEPSVTIVFYFSLFGTVIGGLILPFDHVWPTSWQDAGLFVLLGVMGGAAQLLMTQAYKHADAAVIAPFDYTAMLWAVAIGFIGWGDWPQPAVFLGVAVVIASGLYILHRETRRDARH
jgi:drug/metabolite transporter (DMT)-like permease